MRSKKIASRVWIGFLAATVMGSTTGGAADDWKVQKAPEWTKTWAVKEAPVRFIVALEDAPSHPSAGYFAIFPDGGALPGPLPEPTVFDASGNPLKSAVLWQNHTTGFCLVFETPQSGGEVVVYVSGTNTLRLWSPKTGLTPSAILCSRPGSGSRAEAMQLDNLGPVGPLVHYINQAEHTAKWKQETLGLVMGMENVSVRMRAAPSSLYLLAHVMVTDPGTAWVAPVSFNGQMDVAVDGAMMKPFKKNEKRGGWGSSVTLSAGIHRLECYGYNSAGGVVGPMMLMWRTPKTTVEEMGGKRTAEMKYAGTAMNEARQLRSEEIVRSGHCKVSDVQSRDGGPIACFSVSSEKVFWFGEEIPQIQCALDVVAKKNPAETRYEWTFGDFPGAVAQGKDVTWLFKSGADHWVKLVAEAGGKRSEATFPFLPFQAQGCTLDDYSTRASFNRACLNMLKAYPENADPFEQWDASLWNNFFRVLDIEARNPMLDYLVTMRWEAFRKKADAGKRALVEDIFLLGMEGRNPKEALKWAAEFERNSTLRERSLELRLKMAEIMMYYLNDLEGARKAIRPVLVEGGEIGEWARIRAGDVEFMTRTNLNEATQIYGDVQNRSNHAREADEDAKGDDYANQPAQAGKHKKGARRAAAPAPATRIQEPAPTVAAWKLSAIRDVAASEGVSSLITQRYFLEANKALRKWEREFPLAKVTGDYWLQEAKFYIAIEDYRRARAILTAYCDQVDASNFVTEAMTMIVSCMIYMGEPESAVEKYQKEIGKRMQFGTADEKAGVSK